MTRIALVAGEASGDLLAAHLIEALKRRLPDAEFVGIGGPKMQRAGFDAWWPAETLAVRGYAEVLRHYRKISGVRRELLKRLLREKPDVFIGVDAPDFNLWLEARLKRAGIRTVHYVSPSVWAWRGGRVKRIAHSVDRLLALFPFEPPLFEKAGVDVSYVGHPLADVLPLDVSRPAARELLNLPEAAQPVFALLPGSRQSEVGYMAELFIQTAARLRERFPKAIFLVPLATRETRNLFEAELWKQGVQDWLLDEPTLSATDAAVGRPGSVMKLLFGHAQDALAACDAALVASGTATLEAALLKAPMVITYRMSKWSWRLMRRMRYQPWVGLPNVLAGQFVVPEFLQDDATPENLAQALGNVVLDAGVRMRLGNLFTDMHRQLRQDTAEKAAAAVLPLLDRGRSRRMICGVDEAGRGPLAGPVVAAAVILDPARPIAGLADSKKLSAAKREKLAVEIRAKSIAWCVAEASVEEIDTLNILQATLLAMQRAVAGLAVVPSEALIDGNRCPQLAVPARAIVGGDATVAEISAASILAKTTRDAGLLELHAAYPQYGFDRHKGYGTAAHLAALRAHGPTSHHRKSFAPVREQLELLA